MAAPAIGVLIKNLLQYIPPVMELAKQLVGLTGSGKGTEEQIDKMQSELLQKISEQQLQMSSALELIYKRMLLLYLTTGVSITIAAIALTMSLIR